MLGQAIELLAAFDVTDVISWVRAIPFELWPQQHRVDEQLRPAMVNDLAWEGFGAATDGLVARILQLLPPGSTDYNRMLSVVMPGHSIPGHRDEQPDPRWLRRVHVPLVTNDRAVMVLAGDPYFMPVGAAFLVDTRVEHAIRNDGTTPRIHFMFDVR